MKFFTLFTKSGRIDVPIKDKDVATASKIVTDPMKDLTEKVRELNDLSNKLTKTQDWVESNKVEKISFTDVDGQKVIIEKGGPGSGCQGPNCGRPGTGGDKGQPEPGKQYALTGGRDTPSIARGDTWAESEVKEKPIGPNVERGTPASQVHPKEKPGFKPHPSGKTPREIMDDTEGERGVGAYKEPKFDPRISNEEKIREAERERKETEAQRMERLKTTKNPNNPFYEKPTPKKEFDTVGHIMSYESGELDEEGTRNLFQHLVNTGQAWSLQGHYGRTAQAMLDSGFIRPPKSKKFDTQITFEKGKPNKGKK